MLRRFLPPLLIGLVALAAFQFKAREKMVDFGVYRQASERVLRAEPLFRESDGHFQFKYLPVFAVATIPFALADAETAKLGWFALSVGALVLLLRWSARFVPERRRGLPLLVGLTLLFMLKFYIHELGLGQANLFFALLVVAALGALQSEFPAVAGVLFGAAVAVKPYGIIFAPWLLASEDRRAVVAMAITLVAALLAPMAFYGFNGNIALLADWWRTVTSTTAPNLMTPDNVSFASVWARWLGAGPAASVLAVVTGGISLALVADAWRRRARVAEPAYLEAAALLVLIPLLSPQGWDYVLLLSTPAIALLFDRMPELPRGWRVAAWTAVGVMGLVAFDLVGRAIYQRFMRTSVVTICALTIIVVLAQLRRQRLA